jgi:hypothetical protein
MGKSSESQEATKQLQTSKRLWAKSDKRILSAAINSQTSALREFCGPGFFASNALQSGIAVNW